ncbi:hypothetical protein F5888DRAFT_1808916 [Russula emetica]|nr:hypothetical protein F5888DRAFT_1808916 [Russula emetica]
MLSESTPVLSRAISSSEMFMTEWEKLGEQHEMLRPWMEIGLRWAKKYYIRMDDTDAYVVTMFLNPAMRLSWIQAEWEGHYIRHANVMSGLSRMARKQPPNGSYLHDELLYKKSLNLVADLGLEPKRKGYDVIRESS